MTTYSQQQRGAGVLKERYPWMPWEEVEEIVERKSNISPALQRFLDVYKVIGDPQEMYIIHTDDDRSTTWGKRRDDTIARLLPRYMKNPTYEGQLSLELWAYDVAQETGVSPRDY